jgi:cytidylate kinase
MAREQAKSGAIVIAVDGPAASGKGTIACALATHFGLPHMDTGLLYRAVALNLWRWGGDPSSEFEALRACDMLSIDPADEELRSEPVSKIASAISAYPSVRTALRDRQQEFAGQPGGAVLDGRDIGTVIAPNANVKLFVTASSEVRAQRRVRELLERGMAAHYEDVLADIRARDERDSHRAVAPLKQAPDALLLDTSELDIEEAKAEAIRLVGDRLAAASAHLLDRRRFSRWRDRNPKPLLRRCKHFLEARLVADPNEIRVRFRMLDLRGGVHPFKVGLQHIERRLVVMEPDGECAC